MLVEETSPICAQYYRHKTYKNVMLKSQSSFIDFKQGPKTLTASNRRPKSICLVEAARSNY